MTTPNRLVNMYNIIVTRALLWVSITEAASISTSEVRWFGDELVTHTKDADFHCNESTAEKILPNEPAHMQYERLHQTKWLFLTAQHAVDPCYLDMVSAKVYHRKLYHARFKTREYYTAWYGTPNLLLTSLNHTNKTHIPSTEHVSAMSTSQVPLPTAEEIRDCTTSTLFEGDEQEMCPAHYDLEMNEAAYPHWATFRHTQHAARTSIIPEGFELMDTNKDGIGSREEMLRYFGDRRAGKNAGDPSYREGDVYNIIPYENSIERTFPKEFYGIYYDPEEEEDPHASRVDAGWRGPYPHQRGDTFDVIDFMFIEPTILDKLFYMGDSPPKANGMLETDELERVLVTMLEGRNVADATETNVTAWSVLVDRKKIPVEYPLWIQLTYPLHIFAPFVIKATPMTGPTIQEVLDASDVRPGGNCNGTSNTSVTVDIDLDGVDVKEMIPNPLRVLKSREHIKGVLIPKLLSMLPLNHALVSTDYQFGTITAHSGLLLAEFRRLWYYLLFHADTFAQEEAIPRVGNDSFVINSTPFLDNAVSPDSCTNGSGSSPQVQLNFVSSFLIMRDELPRFPTRELTLPPESSTDRPSPTNQTDVTEDSTVTPEPSEKEECAGLPCTTFVLLIVLPPVVIILLGIWLTHKPDSQESNCDDSSQSQTQESIQCVVDLSCSQHRVLNEHEVTLQIDGLLRNRDYAGAVCHHSTSDTTLSQLGLLESAHAADSDEQKIHKDPTKAEKGIAREHEVHSQQREHPDDDDATRPCDENAEEAESDEESVPPTNGRVDDHQSSYDTEP